jgi:ABC-type uncharacterized transport system ATPase subunit
LNLSKEDNPNEVLTALGRHGMVYHYVAQVPTANDLFVQAIEQNNK